MIFWNFEVLLSFSWMPSPEFVRWHISQCVTERTPLESATRASIISRFGKGCLYLTKFCVRQLPSSSHSRLYTLPSRSLCDKNIVALLIYTGNCRLSRGYIRPVVKGLWFTPCSPFSSSNRVITVSSPLLAWVRGLARALVGGRHVSKT